jgi:hypothetical protein
MKASLIVWDLETVPDIGGFAFAEELAGKQLELLRELAASAMESSWGREWRAGSAPFALAASA